MTITAQRQLKDALKQALSDLEAQGRGETAAAIRPLICEELERCGHLARVTTYLENNPGTTSCDYVNCVADHYEELGSYLHQVQTEKSDQVWQPLIIKMQWWAYNYLRQKKFLPGQQTFQLAKDCAADSAGELVQAHFPYDTTFAAWACTIVQNQCKKAIARLCRAGHFPANKLVSLTDTSPGLMRTADLGGGKFTEWRLTLMHLINQLPAEEQETVLLYGFKGLTFEEIGQQLAISTTTAYRRYCAAIDFLRKNLAPKPKENRPTHLSPNGGLAK
jgi:RNA polymerase sigma factor (sigma-70 family)